MGLNWGQAAENAASGLDRMARQKNIEADMAYKEMAARNRERFDAGEKQLQRDFLSDESVTEREWKEGESAKDRTQKSEEFEVRQADIRSRDEQTNAIREQSNQIQMEGNRIRQSTAESQAYKRTEDVLAAGTKSDAEFRKEMQDRIDALKEQNRGLIIEDADKAANKLEIKSLELAKSTGDPSSEESYMKIAGAMRGHPDTDKYATAYGTMSADQRKLVERERKKLKVNPAEGYARTIDSFIEAQSAPAMKPDTGGVAPPKTETSVKGGAEPTAAETFLPQGPPKPEVTELAKNLEPHIKNAAKGSVINNRFIHGIIKGVSMSDLREALKIAGASPEQEGAISQMYLDAQKEAAQPEKPSFINMGTNAGMNQ